MDRCSSCRSLLGILIAVLVLAGCRAGPGPAAVAPPSASPVASVAPSSTPVPEGPTPLPPAFTAVPTAVPTATPTAAPTKAPPTVKPTATASKASAASGVQTDPKADPLAALRYASAPGRMMSATFAVDMTMTTKPVNEASAQELGAAAEQAQTMTGGGAFQVVDAAANKVNTRMAITVTTAGETMKMGSIAIDDTYWVCSDEIGCMALRAAMRPRRASILHGCWRS